MQKSNNRRSRILVLLKKSSKSSKWQSEQQNEITSLDLTHNPEITMVTCDEDKVTVTR